MIGLAGAHRTGKSTLAQEYSLLAGIPFVQTSTSEVFKEMGFDPKLDYGFKIRMMIQNKILDVGNALWSKYKGAFITDRTPVDMLAYTMADVQRENLDKDDEKLFMEYQARCFELTNRHFGALFVIQPGIQLVDAEGKAPINEAYIEHINTLAIGIANDQRLKINRYILNRSVLDLHKRCETVDRIIHRFYEESIEKRLRTGAGVH